MHLVARYPGYITSGSSFRHIPWYGGYGRGGGGGGALCSKYVKNIENKGLVNFNIIFGVPTSFFLKMVMCI